MTRPALPWPDSGSFGFLASLEIRVTAAGPEYPSHVRTPRQRRRWRKKLNRATGRGSWRYDAPFGLLDAIATLPGGAR